MSETTLEHSAGGGSAVAGLLCERWRVCWTSARGHTVRTRWKTYRQARAHFRDALQAGRNAWLEPSDSHNSILSGEPAALSPEPN